MSRRSIEDLKFDLENIKKENTTKNIADYLKLEKLLSENKVLEALDFVRKQLELNKKAP